MNKHWSKFMMNDSRPVANSKHTSWYMSDHYICLQYLLFLSLIFLLCWLWRNRELVWDIVRGKFAKQLLSVFFLPNEVISYVYKWRVRASVLSLWTCNIMRWFSLESPVVERKYVFTRFKAENDLSLKALVGRAKIRFRSVTQFQIAQKNNST